MCASSFKAMISMPFGKKNISPFIDDVPFPKVGHLNCRLILETTRLQRFWTNMEISPENSNMIKALRKK